MRLRIMAIKSSLAMLLSFARLSAVRSSSSLPPRRLTLNSMSPSLKSMEYAVRGPVVQEADELSARMAAGEKMTTGDFSKVSESAMSAVYFSRRTVLCFAHGEGASVFVVVCHNRRALRVLLSSYGRSNFATQHVDVFGSLKNCSERRQNGVARCYALNTGKGRACLL